jgi:DNA polymerase-1
MAPRYLGESKDKSVEEYIKKHKLETRYRIPGKKKVLAKPHYDRVPFDIITKYGGHDAYLHRKLGLYLESEIGKEADLKRVAENEQRLTKTCYRMERLGIRIDREYVRRGLEHEVGLLNIAKESFADLCGETYDGTKDQLIRVFTAAGERIPKTEKGNDSLTDAILEKFRTPAAKAVQLIRTHEKLISTYYSSFLELATDGDLIHADIRQSGTETGRFSYRDPNLQNVPKEDEAPEVNRPYPVRGCFVPRSEYCFVMIDYSQQEYRMMFDYAGQRDIISAIMGGADAHQATGDILGITRKKAKNTNFAYLYGAGIEQLARTAGVSTQEAKQLKSVYGMKFPYVENFVKKVIHVGRDRGYVKNWFGRRCHIDNPEWAYILPNHLIQGGCADVVKVAMNRLDDYLNGKLSRMVLQVHDEILFEVHKTELDIVPELKRIMESIYPPKNGMTLEASVEHSWKSWAARDKVKGFPCITEEK